MSTYRQRRRMLLHYAAALAAFAVAFALMPFAMRTRERTMLWICADGVLLWSGLIGSVLSAVRINRCRQQSKTFRELYPNMKRLGLTHFFQNKAAAKADVALFGAVLALMIVCIFWRNTVAVFMCIAVTVFTFGMHCMLNGMNYLFINYRKRREKTS